MKINRVKVTKGLSHTLFLFFLGCGICQAQALYRVEVIVFERSAQTESLYRFPGEPDISNVTDFSQIAEISTEQEISPSISLTDRFLLDRPEQLLNVYDKLSRTRGLSPRVHIAWRQPATPFGRPQAVRIHDQVEIDTGTRRQVNFFSDRSTEEAPAVERIDGHIAFERGRYLHLRLDLALHIEKPQQSQLFPTQSGFIEDHSSFRTYRLQERRQVKLGELHYFDHSHFGVVAVVQRVNTNPNPTPTD